MPANQTTVYLTALQAAHHLNMTLPALYGAVRQGVLPAYRLGEKRLRFRVSDLDAAMKREAHGRRLA